MPRFWFDRPRTSCRNFIIVLHIHFMLFHLYVKLLMIMTSNAFWHNWILQTNIYFTKNVNSKNVKFKLTDNFKSHCTVDPAKSQSLFYIMPLVKLSTCTPITVWQLRKVIPVHCEKNIYNNLPPSCACQ